MSYEHELKLIFMIQELQNEQKKYRAEVRTYGRSLTQLEICKRKERELKAYMNERVKQIESEKKNEGKQIGLFQ